MTFNPPAVSALPDKPRRRRKASTEKRRNPDQRVLLRVHPDGSFRAADGDSKKRLRARGFHKYQDVIAYLYRVRDGKQWRKAHVLGQMLADNVEEFHGVDPHAVLKKLQERFDIAMEVERLEVPTEHGKVTFERKTAKSLAFGEMDDSEFSPIFRAMCNKVAETWFPDMDAQAVEDMLAVMPEPA